MQSRLNCFFTSTSVVIRVRVLRLRPELRRVRWHLAQATAPRKDRSPPRGGHDFRLALRFGDVQLGYFWS